MTLGWPPSDDDKRPEPEQNPRPPRVAGALPFGELLAKLNRELIQAHEMTGAFGEDIRKIYLRNAVNEVFPHYARQQLQLMCKVLTVIGPEFPEDSDDGEEVYTEDD